MPKRRIDSWDTALSEEERWKAYDQARFKYHAWAAWFRDEFGTEPPSRSAFYRWKKAMREDESAHRIEAALSERANVQRMMSEVGDISPELQYAWMAMAQDSTLQGDVKGGEKYLRMALALSEDRRKAERDDIKRQAEGRAQEQLELDKREFAQKLRSGIEKGLQALFEQVAGNDQAEKLVLKLQGIVGEKAA